MLASISFMVDVCPQRFFVDFNWGYSLLEPHMTAEE